MRAVIKFGGSIQTDPELAGAFYRTLARRMGSGWRVILVHGGGPAITAALERFGVGTKFVDGLRVTDEATMSVVETVLSGEVNPSIVAGLQREGLPAVGLSGRDGPTLVAQTVTDPPGLGRVGEVTTVRTQLPEVLLGAGFLPVYSPVGQGTDGEALNLNADVAAAELAAAMRADLLLFLSDVPGVIIRGERQRELVGGELEELISLGVVSGGMIPKVRAACRAAYSVGEVLIAGGREFAAADGEPLAGGTRVLAK